MSAVCSTCAAVLATGSVMCSRCGSFAITAGTGLNKPTIKASDLVDACDVDASKIEHIATGPWDPVFGGGVVAGSTVLMAGLAGAGKTTLLLQIAVILARRSGRPGYVISGEQAAGELKFTLNRLGVSLERGLIVVAKSMSSSGLIDDAVLAAKPPSSVIVDSLSEICGQKQYDRQVALARAYKEPVAVKYHCPVFMISQMNKSGDTLGMSALQHGPDALIDVQVIDEGRKRARILRQYGLDDGDVRLLLAFKNRYGPSHQEFPLLMTEAGFTAIPPALKRDERKRPVDPLRAAIFDADVLAEEIEQGKAAIRDAAEELAELRVKIAKLATESEKPKPTKVVPLKQKPKPRATP